MVMRTLVRKYMRAHEGNRRCGPPLGRPTRYALYFAVACGLWLSFKQVEPAVFPVIKDFEITHIVGNGTSLQVSGVFEKVRSCEFVDVVGYSGDTYVAVVFSKYPATNRLPRRQTFGPWTLVPKTRTLELYARHVCSTGAVTTKVFEGAIIL